VVNTSLLDGRLDPLLVAGHYAVLNTVSENYARELQETESDELTGWLGHELKKRNVILQGVTNGIEPGLFASSVIAGADPEMLFDPGKKEDDLSGKLRCKSALLAEIAGGADFHGVERFGTLEVNVEYPLFTFIGRLSEQKGVEVLTEVLGVMLKKDERIQMLILGSGGDDLESRLIALAENEQLHGRICFLRGFGSSLANRIYAAGDFFVVPSKYEPCGLTDFIAQLFGNIPVVRHVGGLVKVKDGVTGIAYQGDSPDDLLEALVRALAVYVDLPLKRKIQLQAVEEIARKYTWTKVMKKYLELYRQAGKTQVCQ
jgi:starch synthase